jgi:hypothetical protein
MQDVAQGATGDVAFVRIARLASALARPFDSFDESAWSSASLLPRELRALSASAHFGNPVRAVALRTVVGDDFDLPAASLHQFGESWEGRLALWLVSAPLEEIETVGLLIAAALLHRAILHTTAKATRQRVQLALGSAAFVVATQEAPVLYPALAASEAPDILRSLLLADDAKVQRGFVRFGVGALLHRAATTAPQLAQLIQNRLPPDLQAPVAGTLPDLDRGLIVKLIGRRMPSWSATIG